MLSHLRLFRTLLLLMLLRLLLRLLLELGLGEENADGGVDVDLERGTSSGMWRFYAKFG